MKNLVSRLEAAESRLREENTDERGRNFVSRVADKGFTLIELLVVITILGILAAIVVFSVAGLGSKGEVEACKTDTVTIRTAEEALYAKTGAYGDMTALTTAPNQLLSQVSTLHTVSLTPAPYTISTIANVKCGPTGQTLAAAAVVDGGTTAW